MTKLKTPVQERNGQAEALKDVRHVQISPPKMEVVTLTIRGTAPLVINRFSRKAIEQMKMAQQAGPQGKKGRKREPKDFQQCYKDAMHISSEGWQGIAAPAFRSAMIDACRLVGFKMTVAKLGLFIEADGYDVVDGTPLVRIIKGEPRYVEHAVRNDSGVADIRPRPMWEPGWEAVVRIKYDAELFSLLDVVNLLARAGAQVGICEGRPNSKNSFGQGWGTFEVSTDEASE